MPQLVLQASDDLVGRLARESDPQRAVIELIWNAIDAEAWNITVRVERDPGFDGIIALHVEDDGHGISPDEVESAFGRIGDSWKSRASRRRSKNNVRGLHGSLGEGRLRAFALGEVVKWTSVASDSTGQLHEVQITGRRSSRNVFEWTAVPASGETGTVVSAHNEHQRNLSALSHASILPALRSAFAPILLHEDGLKVVYDGVEVAPGPEIVNDREFTLSVESSVGVENVELRIIEWRQGKHKMIYYGPDAHHFLFEEDGSSAEAQFSYSAYVAWGGFSGQVDYLVLGELAPSPLDEIWRAVRKAIREHFNERRRERRREQIKRWKSDGIYPYEGEPSSDAEAAERAVFDVVSGTLSPQIARGKAGARLTLALLRDAVRHDPDRLTTILHEVAALNSEDRDTLTALLSETTLAAIIKSANTVASRNKFLLALEHLLFDPTDSADVNERDHLHRLLESELWIFGEGYHLMNSERGLTQLLRTHLGLSGFPESDATTVKRWDGRGGRVDLHLAVRSQEHDRVRHLIIELKAPDISIGRPELDQVEDYGNAIIHNPQFASAKAQWDIILVGTSLDKVARQRVHVEERELGRFWLPADPPYGAPQVKCYVRTWRDIIDENRRRLDFLTKAMQHDPSLAEGLHYVREQYADMLPDAIVNPRSPLDNGYGDEQTAAASPSADPSS